MTETNGGTVPGLVTVGGVTGGLTSVPTLSLTVVSAMLPPKNPLCCHLSVHPLFHDGDHIEVDE